MVPTVRIRVLRDEPLRPSGEFVLSWMIAARRTAWNAALERAADAAEELGKPLVVLEPLDCDYRWACDRFHRFVIDGMADQARRFARAGVTYHPYVEPAPGAGRGLLAALAARACLVVTDESPVLHLPKIVARAAEGLRVRMESVDSNGLLPLAATERVFPTAHAFRRFLQRELPAALGEMPDPDPLRRRRIPRLGALPGEILRRWPAADAGAGLAALPIDHSIGPTGLAGGSRAAGKALDRFLKAGLPRYAEDRNEPGEEVTSGLSPYLHFGHLSAHEIFCRVAEQGDWSAARLGTRVDGRREGWWGLSAEAEAFLDQLVTWRELGYGMASKRPDHDRYESLPPWALRTLEKHAGDPRPHLYTLREFREARTHDPLWNAAQRQLVREGRIHTYLRMLWGKKILEWTRSPREALEILIELNNAYALDGRDPNSYGGIFWTLGRYDRPWGPERPVFGTLRYMSSENTRRKLRVESYLERYGEGGPSGKSGRVRAGRPGGSRSSGSR